MFKTLALYGVPYPKIRPGHSQKEVGASPSGRDSNKKMPGCVCWGYENIPILKEALGKKKQRILKG